MHELSFLAFAAAYRRVGVVFLKDGQLRHWQISGKGAKSPAAATELAASLILAHRPNVVVTQTLNDKCRKGEKIQAVIAAIASEARQHDLLDLNLERRHDYANKYEEAEALVQRYPDLLPWLCQREECYDNEPRNTVLFEALSMAEAAMRGPVTKLAAALG